MKLQSTLNVSIDGQLNMKRQTIIHTDQFANQQTEVDVEEEIVQIVYHIAVKKRSTRTRTLKVMSRRLYRNSRTRGKRL